MKRAKIFSNARFSKRGDKLAQSKYEDMVLKSLKELFPNFVIYTQYPIQNISSDAPKELRRSKIDIFISEFDLAIEVDGEHHYKPVSYGGDLEAQVRFERKKRIDNMKDNFLEERGIHILRINTKDIDKHKAHLNDYIETLIEILLEVDNYDNNGN